MAYFINHVHFVSIAFVITLIMITSINLVTLATAMQHIDVLTYGAKANGIADSTKAFLAAWDHACALTGPVKFYVPHGRFLVKRVVFQGPCMNSRMFFRIDGTIMAPSDFKVLAYLGGNWITFSHVDGVTVSGGILDAQGASLWSCKNSGNTCPTGAASLGFSNSSNVVISRLTSINSQLFHIVINGCENVRVQGVKVIASEDSPNTDGIHVQFSTGITISYSYIATGDDCVSIGPGSSNLCVEHISCGPGHGISIGSLGWDYKEAGVKNVTVKSVKFTGTQNGVRIKTWGRPSNGFAEDIFFEHINMINVQNPIVIDQNYCPSATNCPGKASGVKISKVTYQHIHGTSATEVAVRLDCSKKNPCTEVTFKDVKLTYNNQIADASCTNADGTATGLVQPSGCL